MQTRTALATIAGIQHEWGDGPLSQVAPRLLEAFRVKEAAKLDAPPPGPLFEALQHKLAAQAEAELFDMAVPAASRYDLVTVLQAAAKTTPEDRGLKHAAAHALQIFERDPHGIVAVGDLARMRAFYTREYPKTQIATVLEGDLLTKSGFNTLPVRKLAVMAADITGSTDAELEAAYGAVVRAHGLDSQKPEHIRARAYIRGLVNLAQEETRHPVAERGGEAAVSRALAKMATGDDALLRSVAQIAPATDDGSASDIDEHALNELDLYIENTAELYNQKKSIIENIKRKVKSGRYDATLAPKLWMYWVDAGARHYVQEFGGDVKSMFPRPVRMALAEQLARDYETRIRDGEFDDVGGGKTGQMGDDMPFDTPPTDDDMVPGEEALPHEEGPETMTEVESPITGDPLVLELGVLEHFGQLEDYVSMTDELGAGGEDGSDGEGSSTTTTIEDPSAPGELIDVTLTPSAGDDDMPPADLVPTEGIMEETASAMTASAPPGAKYERMIRELKKDPSVDNPFAVAWAQYNREKKGRASTSRFLVFAVSGGRREAEPIDRVLAESMPRALRAIAKKVAEVHGQLGAVDAPRNNFASCALVTVGPSEQLLVVAEEARDVFAPKISPPPKAAVPIPEDGAKALTAAAGPAARTAVETELLEDRPVRVGEWAIRVADSGDVEILRGDNVVVARPMAALDATIADFLARTGGAELPGRTGVAAASAGAAVYTLRPLFLAGCARCGRVDEYLMPKTASAVRCPACQHVTAAAEVARQIQAQPTPGFIVVTDVPGANQDLQVKRILAAVRKIDPAASGAVMDGRLEIVLRAVDDRRIAAVRNLLETRFGVRYEIARPAPTTRRAQVTPTTTPAQETPPTLGVQIAPQQPQPNVQPTYTPPPITPSTPIGLAQPIVPQAPSVPQKDKPEPKAPPAVPGVAVQVRGPSPAPMPTAAARLRTRAAKPTRRPPPATRRPPIFVVAYRGVDGRPLRIPVEARDEKNARRIFASYKDAEILSITAQEAPPAMPAPPAPALAEPSPLEPPGATEMAPSGAPGSTIDPMTRMPAIAPEVKEAITAAMLTWRNSGVDIATAIKQFQSQFKELVDRYGDESSPARQALGAEIVRAAQEAWTKPALLEIAADARGAGRRGQVGKLKITLEDSADGGVIVSSDDVEGAMNDQSIMGSRWENADGMAYAIIDNQPGLVAKLEAEGYDVTDFRYEQEPEAEASGAGAGGTSAGYGAGYAASTRAADVLRPAVSGPPSDKVPMGTGSSILGPDSATDPKANRALDPPAIKTQHPWKGPMSDPDLGPDHSGDAPAVLSPAVNKKPSALPQGSSLSDTDLGRDSQTGDNPTTHKWDSVSRSAG